MSFNLALVIGIVIAIAATIASYVLIMPNGKRKKLPSFFKFLHDLFNFRLMVLEKLVKVLYVFLTFSCIIIGILLLFGPDLFIGILVMVLGTVLLRVVFELIMMRIIEVQNVISINRKMKK